jgi:hypothetical protein
MSADKQSKLKFYLHCCALDSECRGDIGWCWRVHLNTPWWHVAVALRPADMFVKLRDLEAADLYANSNKIYSWVDFGKW